MFGDFVVLNVKDLVSKEKNKPFKVIQLQHKETGVIGDLAYFGQEAFAAGDICTFDMALNYRYQWVALLSHK